MKPLIKLSRRGLVRIISFTTALVAILTVTAVVSFTAAYRYRTYVEYAYQRALSELSDYIGNIDMTLQKGQYASTPPQIQHLATKLWQETGNAKSALSQLPGGHDEVGATTRFLSQLGDYCMTLSRRVGQGEQVTEDEEALLDQLAGYASNLSAQLRQMVADLESGRLRIGEVQSLIESGNVSEQVPAINSGFRDLEDNFSNYPAMVYDGPFSDHIQQHTSKLLKDAHVVSADMAMKLARETTGDGTLERSDDIAGNLPCYRFIGDAGVVTVTKAGGLLECILGSREVGEPVMSREDALKAADEVLRARDITEFENRYYEIVGGVLVVNYAVKQDGVILYPDLVKVGIAMDTGKLYSYDAKGYILNHTQRELVEVKVSEEQARAVLNKRLTPTSHSLALIPADGLTEILCHEFLCEGRNGQQVLVYINVQTGFEEQILLLLINEDGVLSM